VSRADTREERVLSGVNALDVSEQHFEGDRRDQPAKERSNSMIPMVTSSDLIAREHEWSSAKHVIKKDS
jgi:hypothetical protein